MELTTEIERTKHLLHTGDSLYIYLWESILSSLDLINKNSELLEQILISDCQMNLLKNQENLGITIKDENHLNDITNFLKVEANEYRNELVKEMEVIKSYTIERNLMAEKLAYRTAYSINESLFTTNAKNVIYPNKAYELINEDLQIILDNTISARAFLTTLDWIFETLKTEKTTMLYDLKTINKYDIESESLSALLKSLDFMFQKVTVLEHQKEDSKQIKHKLKILKKVIAKNTKPYKLPPGTENLVKNKQLKQDSEDEIASNFVYNFAVLQRYFYVNYTE